MNNYRLTVSRNTYSRAIDISSNEPCRQQSVDYIYYTVQPGDTLHNLSFKYSCPVASIKRLNNLWSDQEFYGLTKLKLPVGKLRLIADVIDDSSSKPNNYDTPTSTAPSETLNQVTTTFNQCYSNHIYDAQLETTNLDQSSTSTIARESIFKDLDLNIEKARSAALSYNDNASAIMQSLADSGNIVANEEEINDPNRIACREAEILLNDMSDYGLSYSGLILFIFIVCLVCPLAYVIYLEENHHDSNKAP